MKNFEVYTIEAPNVLGIIRNARAEWAAGNAADALDELKVASGLNTLVLMREPGHTGAQAARKLIDRLRAEWTA